MHKFNNVITMGCRLNSWESNKINSFIRDDKKNDVMIFNSCCVTNDAVKSLKKNIKLFHKSNPDVKIVVTGCAVESERHNLENMEEVSYIIKNDVIIKVFGEKVYSLNIVFSIYYIGRFLTVRFKFKEITF